MRALVLLLLAGCQSGLSDARALAPLDEAYFRCKVQPILTKSCATFACHGDGKRYFRVYARNRLRLGGTEKERNAALSPEERAANFNSARAVVDRDAPERSLLLLKALEASQGGYFHRGAEIFGGGNVYRERDDSEFKVLEKWIQGEKEASDCIEPGSDL